MSVGYEVIATDCLVIKQLCRLRGLLAVDPITKGSFADCIRLFPPSNAEAGPPVVALYSPDFNLDTQTLGRGGIGKYKKEPRVILSITVLEPQRDADMDALYVTLLNVTNKFTTALTKYNSDPTPGDGGNLWYGLKWLSNGDSPGAIRTVALDRVEGKFLRSITQFELSVQSRIPT